MTLFSQRSLEGYLMIDHRASPGLPEEFALKHGFDPAQVKEGKVYETPTMGCVHCGAHVVMNPKRTRERAFCQLCNQYICDWCDAARHEPDYVHRHINDLKDIAVSDKYLLGGSMSRPIIIPKDSVHG